MLKKIFADVTIKNFFKKGLIPLIPILLSAASIYLYSYSQAVSASGADVTKIDKISNWCLAAILIWCVIVGFITFKRILSGGQFIVINMTGLFLLICLMLATFLGELIVIGKALYAVYYLIKTIVYLIVLPISKLFSIKIPKIERKEKAEELTQKNIFEV